MTTAEHVDMEVKDALAGVLAVVHVIDDSFRSSAGR